MIKTMCCLGSATLGVLLLSACSSPGYPPPDISILSTGKDNTVSTGGYFWTYTDHNADGNKYHATIQPISTKKIALTTTTDDAAHGSVFNVKGSVPPALPWTGDATTGGVSTQADYTIDQYWATTYPNPKAMVPVYPAAGLGFGFQAGNAPFDATQGGKYIGVAFDMKLNDASMTTVWSSYPMVGTDLPDPAFDDVFPAPGQAGGCKYYTADNTPASGYQTCFTNYRKGYHDSSSAKTQYSTLAAAGTWKRYCTLFAEVGIPNWANPLNQSNVPAFNPTKILKMQWDMFQPAETATSPATFDFSVDNVNLLTTKDAMDAKNNCDPAMIGQDAGTGNEG